MSNIVAKISGFIGLGIYFYLILTLIVLPEDFPIAQRIHAYSELNPFAARFAVDGRTQTRWDTGKDQIGGESIVFDIGASARLHGVRLEYSGSAGDFPRGIEVFCSQNGADYSPQTITIYSEPSATSIRLKSSCLTRFVKLVQTGSAPNTYWSIHEVKLDYTEKTKSWLAPYRWLAFFVAILLPLSAYRWRKALARQIPRSKNAVVLSVIFLVLGSGLLSTNNNENTWALSFFQQLPSVLQILELSVLILLTLSAIAFKIKPLTNQQNATPMIPYSWDGRILAPTYVVAMLALSWLLRSHATYGDGDSTVSLLMRGEIINWKEPFDRLLTATLATVGQTTGAFGPREAIALISTTAGAFYWVGCLDAARLFSRSTRESLLILALLSSAGVTQLFYGNIENYSLVGVGVFWFFILGIKAIRTSTSIVPASLALALACSLHLSAIWAIPALVILAILTNLRDHEKVTITEWIAPLFKSSKKIFLIFFGWGAVTIGSVYYLTGDMDGLSVHNFGGGDGSLFIPLLAPTSIYEKYTLLSGALWIALINLAALMCCGALSMLLGSLSRTGISDWTTRRELLFLKAGCVTLCGYPIFLNADLAYLRPGLLNEWDLLSLPAFPIMLFSIAFWSSRQFSNHGERIGIIAYSIICNLVLTIPWIVSNALT